MTESPARPTTVPNVLIALFLTVQLLLPLRGFLYDRYDTRANFSWNMYAAKYGCGVAYRYRTPAGATRTIDVARFFKRPERAAMMLNRDGLPRLHAWLCRRIPPARRVGSIEGAVSCVLSDAQPVALVPEGTRICDPPSYGVRPR